MTDGLKTYRNVSRSAEQVLFEDEVDELFPDDLLLECFEELELEFATAAPSGASKAKTTSWKWPTNSGSLSKASLHIKATS